MESEPDLMRGSRKETVKRKRRGHRRGSAALKNSDIDRDAQNSDETAAKRVIGRPFPKGTSGNPGGRPKKRLIDEVLEELLLTDDSAVAQTVAAALLKKAKRGDVKAIQLLAERVQGKPRQAVQLTGAYGGPIELRDVTREQARERILELTKKISTSADPAMVESLKQAWMKERSNVERASEGFGVSGKLELLECLDAGLL
jgi:hypothetical protein